MASPALRSDLTLYVGLYKDFISQSASASSKISYTSLELKLLEMVVGGRREVVGEVVVVVDGAGLVMLEVVVAMVTPSLYLVRVCFTHQRSTGILAQATRYT